MGTTQPDRKTKDSATSPAPALPRNEARSKAASEDLRSSRSAKAPDPGTEGAPTGQLVSEVRSAFGVTREFFARMTGFSVRAISGWEADRPLSEAALRRIKEMKRLRDAPAEGLRPEFIPEWRNRPCEGLKGLKPAEVLERGETDRLWSSVLLIGSGMPT
jgi:DNA-binding transcriptional regulator YiaG